MKKPFLNTMLLIVAGMLFSIFAIGQIMPPIQNSVSVYPSNPTSKDSVYMAYTYVSNDGCPDFMLVKDTIVGNQINVKLKSIDNSQRICTQVITKFALKMNLGLLAPATQIYFEGTLIKTIAAPCNLDKMGLVVAGINECAGQIFIEDTSSPYMSIFPQLYAIENNGSTITINGLHVGNKVKFGGYLIKNDTSRVNPCRIVGVATCWEIISDTTCLMDQKGIVIEYKDNSSLIKDLSSGDIYAINDVKLAINTKILFKGTKIQCITTPCYNIVECYQIIEIPPVPCVIDKKGLVVTGTEGCTGQIFIQEYSPISSVRQLYAIQSNITPYDSNTLNKLRVGDEVKFGGYLIKNDSAKVNPCHIVGVATCWEVISDTTCLMDQKGIVTAFNDNSSLIKDLSSGDIYAINDVKLAINTKILFKGTKIQCITTPCYNIVECYQIIEIPPVPCVMDKKGLVVTGIEGCAGQIFIQEYSPISSVRQLYAIQSNITPYESNTLNKLRVGDEVKFGGYLIKNDTSRVNPCHIVGIATCWDVISDTVLCEKDRKGIITGYVDNSSIVKDLISGVLFKIRDTKVAVGTSILFKGIIVECFTTDPIYSYVECDELVNYVACYQIISTPPFPCVMDKEGVVVPGIDGCTGQLFIQEFSPNSTSPRLYLIKGEMINTDSNNTLVLKVGDKVRFGGYLSKNDSTMSILCSTVGVATCYQVINTENTYSLGGYTLAGTDTIQTGYAVLFKKGAYKATASNMIINGTFTFAHLPKAEYTVYVIPDITIYKKYLPTFYTNKLKFKNADYIYLDTDIDNLVVNLRQFTFPTGIGKIYGNIFFDTYSLRDSVLAKTGSVSSTITSPIATNTAIVLYDISNEPVAWTMTDAYGNYVFENIALGTYKVVCETAAAIAESVVVLTPESASVNADMVLKSQQIDTNTNDISEVVLRTFPNPVAGNLTIELKEASEIDVYNLLGKLIIHERLNAGVNVLNLSNISKGIYFAKIGKSTIKIVKN